MKKWYGCIPEIDIAICQCLYQENLHQWHTRQYLTYVDAPHPGRGWQQWLRLHWIPGHEAPSAQALCSIYDPSPTHLLWRPEMIWKWGIKQHIKWNFRDENIVRVESITWISLMSDVNLVSSSGDVQFLTWKFIWHPMCWKRFMTLWAHETNSKSIVYCVISKCISIPLKRRYISQCLKSSPFGDMTVVRWVSTKDKKLHCCWR